MSIAFFLMHHLLESVNEEPRARERERKRERRRTGDNIRVMTVAVT